MTFRYLGPKKKRDLRKKTINIFNYCFQGTHNLLRDWGSLIYNMSSDQTGIWELQPKLKLEAIDEQEGNTKAAEKHYIEAGDWKSAVHMYRGSDAWEVTYIF